MTAPTTDIEALRSQAGAQYGGGTFRSSQRATTVEMITKLISDKQARLVAIEQERAELAVTIDALMVAKEQHEKEGSHE